MFRTVNIRSIQDLFVLLWVVYKGLSKDACIHYTTKEISTTDLLHFFLDFFNISVVTLLRTVKFTTSIQFEIIKIFDAALRHSFDISFIRRNLKNFMNEGNKSAEKVKIAPKKLYNQWLKLLRSIACLHEYRIHARPDCNFWWPSEKWKFRQWFTYFR